VQGSANTPQWLKQSHQFWLKRYAQRWQLLVEAHLPAARPGTQTSELPAQPAGAQQQPDRAKRLAQRWQLLVKVRLSAARPGTQTSELPAQPAGAQHSQLGRSSSQMGCSSQLGPSSSQIGPSSSQLGPSSRQLVPSSSQPGGASPSGALQESDSDGALQQLDGAQQQPDRAKQQPAGVQQQSDGALQQPTGTLQQPAGAQQQSDGALQQPTGTLQQPAGAQQQSDGALQQPTGTLQESDGALQESDGAQQQPTGTLQQPAGAQQQSDGALQQPTGTLQESDGALQESDGAQQQPADSQQQSDRVQQQPAASQQQSTGTLVSAGHAQQPGAVMVSATARSTAVARMAPDSEPPDCPESQSSSSQFFKLASPLTPFSVAAAFAALRATKGLDAFNADLYRLVQQLPILVQGVKKLITQGVSRSHPDMAPLFNKELFTMQGTAAPATGPYQRLKDMLYSFGDAQLASRVSSLCVHNRESWLASDGHASPNQWMHCMSCGSTAGHAVHQLVWVCIESETLYSVTLLHCHPVASGYGSFTGQEIFFYPLAGFFRGKFLWPRRAALGPPASIRCVRHTSSNL